MGAATAGGRVISYATCLYRSEVYERVCLPALERQRQLYGAEILTESDPDGICHAYERLRRRASHPTIVYLHDDLELLDDDATPRILRLMDDAGAGLMGVVGSADTSDVIPWWKGETVGSWCWVSRDGKRMWQRHSGDAQAAPYDGQRAPYGDHHDAMCLDGIVLCDRTGLPWPDFDGWHGYDVDRSQAALAAGHRVIVGDLSVCHHGQGHEAGWMESLEPIMQAQRDKWGLN